MEPKNRRSNKIFGISGLVFQFFVCMIYSFLLRTPASQQIDDSRQPIPYMYISLLWLFIVVGFGLLLSSVGKLSFSGLGFVLLICSIVVQMYFIFNTFWSKSSIQKSGNTYQTYDYPFYLSYVQDKNKLGANLGQALKCALAITVVFSMLIGRLGPLQLLIISVFGTGVYEFTRQVNIHVNGNDLGSMKIFEFGGGLGLGISIIISGVQGQMTVNNKQHLTSKNGGTLSLIGLLFIISLFPILTFQGTSFLVFHQYIAPLNVIYAVASSGLTSILLSLIKGGPKTLILGTISGGVAVLSSSCYILHPVYAILIGIISPFIQLGLIKVNEEIQGKFGVFDSFGGFVFLGHGFIGSIWATIHESITRGNTQGFPFVDIVKNVDYFGRPSVYNFVNGWTTLAISISSGLLLGLFVSFIPDLDEYEFFTDRTYWELEDQNIIIEQDESQEQKSNKISNKISQQESQIKIEQQKNKKLDPPKVQKFAEIIFNPIIKQKKNDQNDNTLSGHYLNDNFKRSRQYL